MKIDRNTQINTIQQETSLIQQHAENPKKEKTTFCGVKYNERKRWYKLNENFKAESYIKYITCGRCRRSIMKDLRNQLKIGDEVFVEDPKANDLWSHAFSGNIVDIKDKTLSVEDQEGNIFDMNLKQVDSLL